MGILGTNNKCSSHNHYKLKLKIEIETKKNMNKVTNFELFIDKLFFSLNLILHITIYNFFC